MIVVSTLKILCDIVLYFTFAGAVGALFGGTSILASLPFFAAGIFLSLLLKGRGRLRYAPLILLAGAFLIVPFHLANILVLIPACAYAVYSVRSPEEDISKYDYTRIFHLFIYIFIPFFLLFYILGLRAPLQTATLPGGLVFLAGAILLMRMLRHDETVLKEKRFMVINLLSVAGVMVISLALGSQALFNFLKSMVSFLYLRVLAPLLMYIITGIIYVFSWLYSLFTSGEARSFRDIQFEFQFGMGDMEQFEDPGESLAGDIFKYVLYAIAAAVIIFLVIKLFKALSRKNEGDPMQAEVIETRSALNVSAKPPKRRRRDLSGRIREVYRKLLILCRDKGMELPPHLTSRDVERKSSSLFGKPEEARRMRDIYIRVRYAEETPDQDDLKKAKLLYDAFKKDSAG